MERQKKKTKKKTFSLDPQGFHRKSLASHNKKPESHSQHYRSKKKKKNQGR